MNEPVDEPTGTASQIARHSGYGITLAVAVGLFAWLGHLLDGLVHTAPLFLIIGAAIGFGGGMYRLIHEVAADAEPDDGETF